ncbi:MAG: hypothetical protein ACK4Q5_11470 [Saprospiraceae bacterium]
MRVRFFPGFCLLFLSLAAFGQPAADAPAKVYRGMRVSLYGFKLLDQSEKTVILRCNAVNTGRDPVSFGKDKKPPLALIVELDTLNLPERLRGKEADVVAAFCEGRVNLAPGQLQQGINLKIAVPVPEPKKNPMPQRPIEDPKSEPTAPAQPKVEAKPEPQPEPVPAMTEKGCPDLVFDTIYIVKQSAKTMRLHFVLRNVGDATARLLGPTDEREDNLAVNVYFVSGQKLTRGSFLADGMFFKNKDIEQGILLPGRRLHGEIEISTRNRTRFQPNLVFELDPFQSLADECNKTNNTRALVVNFEF